MSHGIMPVKSPRMSLTFRKLRIPKVTTPVDVYKLQKQVKDMHAVIASLLNRVQALEGEKATTALEIKFYEKDWQEWRKQKFSQQPQSGPLPRSEPFIPVHPDRVVRLEWAASQKSDLLARRVNQVHLLPPQPPRPHAPHIPQPQPMSAPLIDNNNYYNNNNNKHKHKYEGRNVIVRGLVLSAEPTVGWVQNFFAKAGIFEEVKISQLFWFKTKWGKDLLKIQMASEADAKKVLGLKNTLRWKEEYKKVFITADRPPHERGPKIREKAGGFITYHIPQQSTTSQAIQTQPNTYPVPQPHPFPPIRQFPQYKILCHNVMNL